MNKSTLAKQLSQVQENEVYFGPQGFVIASSESELENAQQGYSVDDEGLALSVEELGGWEPHWLVIAQDTELGDPYFVDVNDPQFPVYTGVYGEGVWESTQVASSLAAFLQCLSLLSKSGNQQGPQFVPDENSLTDPGQLAQLQQDIVALCGCEGFWALFFDCYLDWLSDEDDEFDL
ncbi:SMI1/KNR4 family protein [Thalassomonas sp. RHCl1]|uniref:SMI1/KNR4 family protein n=1 Tax=Thalassomonas sp. RHCl1 TaxID=2995320 RepID=UPI00248BCCED|nr:SMI1/KNR4 family protein [Thalassomonas sp. RHCl1]